MKTLTTVVIMMLISSCLFAQKGSKKQYAQGITGTWKLIEFADFDSVTNAWKYRYGKNLRGYFTYTPAGC
jgi:hypothetical protein